MLGIQIWVFSIKNSHHIFDDRFITSHIKKKYFIKDITTWSHTIKFKTVPL